MLVVVLFSRQQDEENCDKSLLSFKVAHRLCLVYDLKSTDKDEIKVWIQI